MKTYAFRNSSEALPRLLKDLLRDGAELPSRNGRVREFTHVALTLACPWERELLVAERKPSIAAQVAETMWVLSGRDDVAWLSHYLPRAADFSDDGVRWRGGYGPRLRRYGPDHIDQVQHVIDVLTKDPTSRQAVINIYDATIDTEPGLDIPCNDLLMFLIRDGRLHLHVTVRSNDIMWGWSGINAFEWSVLQELVASILGVKRGPLHFSIASLHLYERHWDKAGKIVEAGAFDVTHLFGVTHLQESPVPPLRVQTLEEWDQLADTWFRAEREIREGRPALMSSIPDPTLRDWLNVARWWWGNGSADHIVSDRLRAATTFSVAPKAVDAVRQPKPELTSLGPMLTRAAELHAEKHAAYGDSWCRRGELMGILANIARKVDRLEVGGETDDETQLDTAMDTMIYLAKYRAWLGDLPPHIAREDHVETVSQILWHGATDLKPTDMPDSEIIERLSRNLDQLESLARSEDFLGRVTGVGSMLADAMRLTARRFEAVPTTATKEA